MLVSNKSYEGKQSMVKEKMIGQRVVYRSVRSTRKLKAGDNPEQSHGTRSQQGCTGHHKDLGCYTKLGRKSVRDFEQRVT